MVDAFIRTEIRARSALVMFGIGAINAVAALLIGMTVSNVLSPGTRISLAMNASQADTMTVSRVSHRIDFVQTLVGMVPTSIVQPFVDNSILGVIVLAVLAGLALRKVKNQSPDKSFPLEDSIAIALRATQIALAWVIRLVPLAVFGVVAMTVGRYGFSPFRGLAFYVLAALLGLAIQIGVIYQAWLYFTRGTGAVRRFWRGSRDAIVYAFGASSSLATLPVTLECLDEMKVSPQSARLATCVGSNFNHDGIILYEAMAVLVIAQQQGIHLTLSQQALAAVCCVIAGIGIAGVPDAGLVSLALVVTTVGLPTYALPLLLTVDWLLSRARAITNVLSDIVMAMLLDHFSGDDKDGTGHGSAERG